MEGFKITHENLRNPEKLKLDTQDINIWVIFTVFSIRAPDSLKMIILQAEHENMEVHLSVHGI